MSSLCNARKLIGVVEFEFWSYIFPHVVVLEQSEQKQEMLRRLLGSYYYSFDMLTTTHCVGGNGWNMVDNKVTLRILSIIIR